VVSVGLVYAIRKKTFAAKKQHATPNAKDLYLLPNHSSRIKNGLLLYAYLYIEQSKKDKGHP